MKLRIDPLVSLLKGTRKLRRTGSVKKSQTRHQSKRNRRRQNALTVIDLFAGVGGLSLGAARAKFDIKCAVEIDKQAVATHTINFPNTVHVSDDVRSLRGEKLLQVAGLGPGNLGGLIGGPPCQGFSAIGLRTAGDPRNELLVDFFRLVNEVRPAFYLAENVPGILDERNAAVLMEAKKRVPRKYVQLEPLVVKASDYGVPTSRTRIFFYGYDPDRVAPLVHSDFVQPNADDVRVRDALAGLPSIRSKWQSAEQSWRSVDALDDSAFAKSISNNIPTGVGDKEAIVRFKNKREVSGFLGTMHKSSTVKRFDALGPGESDPVSKCTRLDSDGYCPTLRAGTGPERGSYQAIRPVHPTSPRVIAPREGARLQGFPDWFQFHPTKWHAFRQIGNSVSPIAAEFLLGVIHGAMH